jgi:PAS domain S-box-containing protein
MLHYMLIAACLSTIPMYLVERKKAHDEKERFQYAIISAEAGRWYWDLETDELQWDEQMFKLFGYPTSEWSPNYSGFEDALHPEDKRRVNALVENAIKNRTGYQDIFRVVTRDGEVRFIRAAGRVSKSGRYMTGICLPAVPTTGHTVTING